VSETREDDEGMMECTTRAAGLGSPAILGNECNGFVDNRAGNFHGEQVQTLVVTQLTTNDIRGSKCFVRLRAADNGLLGPIAILIVLVRVLCFGA
jgi:hypothetical protein